MKRSRGDRFLGRSLASLERFRLERANRESYRIRADKAGFGQAIQLPARTTAASRNRADRMGRAEVPAARLVQARQVIGSLVFGVDDPMEFPVISL